MENSRKRSILPFRGLRYNLAKLAQSGSTLQDVVTPPYDVINEVQQNDFYKRHLANFVRVDLNPKTNDDSDTNNPYTRAASELKQWETAETLIPEGEPSIYAYSQSWEEAGETIERKGAIVLLKLSELPTGPEDSITSRVLPHEFTLKGPKQDRIQLMRSTLCGLSQIFMLYSDPTHQLEKLLFDMPEAGHNEIPPTLPPPAKGGGDYVSLKTLQKDWTEVKDADGVRHRFRPVTDAALNESVCQLLEDKTLLIADGHHRYETALAYQREVRNTIKAKTGQEPPDGSLLSDYTMVFVTNMDNPGLKVYPTHRIMYRWPKGWTQQRFENALFQSFVRLDKADAAKATFAYRGAESHSLIYLKIRDASKLKHLPPLLDSFDAAILEEIVFKGILGSSGEALKQSKDLGFYRNEEEIDALWEKRNAVAGFYLTAPSVKLVHRICESGYRMPQKSTYFYPKILSGLVIYPYRPFLKGGEPVCL